MNVRETVRSVAISLILLGVLALFYSFAIIVVFPEGEHSAFPWPLGVPALVTVVVAAVMYVIAIRWKPSADAQENERSA